MERDKVLEMASTEGDEREVFIFTKGFMLITAGTLFGLILLYILRLIVGNYNNSDLSLIFATQIVFSSLYYLKVKKSKASIIASILSVTAFIIGFIVVLTEYGIIQ